MRTECARAQSNDDFKANYEKILFSGQNSQSAQKTIAVKTFIWIARALIHSVICFVYARLTLILCRFTVWAIWPVATLYKSHTSAVLYKVNDCHYKQRYENISHVNSVKAKHIKNMNNLQYGLRGSELQQQFDNRQMSVPYSIMEWRVIFITGCIQQGSLGDQHLHNSQVTKVTRFMLEQKA